MIRRLMGFMAMMVLGGASWAQTIQPAHSLSAEELVKEGIGLQAEKRWREALSRHDAARRLDPSFWTAYVAPLDCLVIGLAQEQDSARRRVLLTELRQRFALARERPEAGLNFLLRWSQTVRQHVLPLVGDSEDSRVLIGETRAMLGAAELQASDDDLSRLHLEQAGLEVMAAHVVRDEGLQREAFRRARKLLEMVFAAKPEIVGAAEREWYGVTLLHLGRLDRDDELVRRAVSILEQVASPTASYATIYNLACAYAVAGAEQQALESLARALAMKPSLIHEVLKDNEWEALRQHEPFRRLLNRHDPQIDEQVAQARETYAAAAHAFGLAEVELYKRAADMYQKLLELRPDDGLLHHEAARVFQQRGKGPGPAAERARWLREAYRCYAKAAELRPTWEVFRDWAVFLRNDLGMREADPDTLPLVLKESVQRFEQALELTQFTADRLKVQLDLATTLVRLGMSLPEDAPVAPYYERALRLLPEVLKREEYTTQALPYHVWGLAHLGLARPHRNRLMLHQALERFHTALQYEPDNPEVRYNLACAYALLGDSTAAIRELRACLERARGGPYANLLATDSDFDGIRHLPEFAALQNAGVPQQVFPGPTLPQPRF
ncbi:MAG: tetratricopeptide repeat protein [Verrucomicrobiae bacterium]|nr:tetratricopeptide repeat protein [Verrucomicrobiae bacterium]